ncbi:hypothetical protein LX36DRAFT_446826 [Colletotrichum falcatum]|nr:hypothetical protein LX36DRAFT_446826 [Colletotrichum falcatum]
MVRRGEARQVVRWSRLVFFVAGITWSRSREPSACAVASGRCLVFVAATNQVARAKWQRLEKRAGKKMVESHGARWLWMAGCCGIWECPSRSSGNSKEWMEGGGRGQPQVETKRTEGALKLGRCDPTRSESLLCNLSPSRRQKLVW